MCAALISGAPTEGDVCQLDNAGDLWFMELRTSRGVASSDGDVGVYVGVDDRRPGPGDRITFDLTAKNDGYRNQAGPLLIRVSNEQFGVEVRVELSPGLTFGTVPDEFVPDPNSQRSGVWRAGDLSDGCNSELLRCEAPLSPIEKTGQFQVIVSADPAFLESLCLTAQVVQAVPFFPLDPQKRENDVFTLCLGKPPPVSDGEIMLWWLHDCVGSSTPPCGDDDSLELFTRVNYGDFKVASIPGNDLYVDPEDLIFQVLDTVGRQYDTHTNSVTDGTTVSWQTGRKESGIFNQDGVRVWYSREGFNDNIADWSNTVWTLTAEGLNGATAPGGVKARFDGSNANTLLEANSTVTRTFTLSTPRTRGSDFFLEFSTLGTYVVNFHALATRTDNSQYTASGDYTFHVGPIAELEVSDVGRNPLATPEQQAYTIVAMNHGPDAAPAVEVTLIDVPQGAEAILTKGTYREHDCVDGLCRGVWDLGEFPVPSPKFAGGHVQFPTLTLIAPDGADARPHIQASIHNTEEYSVTIDGTVHSTYYLDYIERNSENVVIAARQGTGEGAPGTPRAPIVRTFPNLSLALLEWESVDILNGWDVVEYEVIGFPPDLGQPCHYPDPGEDAPVTVRGELYVDLSLGVGEAKCYAVRAVNVVGDKSYWSPRVSTVRDAGQPPGIVLSERRVTVAENGRGAGYTVKLNRRPTGDVGVALKVDNLTAATVSPGLLAFGPDNWNLPQTVTVTGVNDDVANPGGRRQTTIRHTARGGGFDSADEQAVTVTVSDDGDEAGLDVPGEVLSVTGGGGEIGYSVRLKSQPADSVRITVRSSDDEKATVNTGSRVGSEDQLQSVLWFDSANWQQPQNVVVTFHADSGQVTITHAAESDDPNYDGISTAVAVEAIPAVLKPTVRVEAGSCVVSGEQATFTLRADHPVPKDLRIDYTVGRNWRAVPEDDLGSGTATIAEGAEYVEIRVPTQQLPKADEPIPGDGRIRKSGVPGTATVLLGDSAEYDIVGENIAHVLVYHTDESHHCR